MKTLISVAAVLILVCIGAGCGRPSSGPLIGPDPEDLIREIEKAPITKVTPQEVAEAFALWSDATDLQRELIEQELVGSVVEWEVQVYEVSLSEGIYKVTSQPIAIDSTEAVPLLRVVALIQARDEKDHQLLRAIKTNDVITARGIVREILLRTLVILEPAVVMTQQLTIEKPPRA